MVSINTMPPNTRVWVYQADRKLGPEETALIKEATHQFISEWSAHGAPLTAGFGVFKSYFWVIAVDEADAAATGCSIDKSVNFVKEYGAKVGVDFFNRLNIATELNGHLELIPLNEFEILVKRGDINADTVVYDNTITTIGDFNNRWHTAAGNTWMSRYFAKQTVK